ncbi:MAG: cyclopropane-fatty-acyl-phospholipid synthase family protein, partial [Salinisphaera sp.]|nr:cyclopropane-fatty-acyl-phospholipid synthase family protein [Salinisphaera sp.]
SIGHGEPAAHMHLRGRQALRRMLRRPDIAVGEAYMDGDWSPGEGGLIALFRLYFCNADSSRKNPIPLWVRRLWDGASQYNGRRRARRNVHNHYDLDADLFHTFLGRELHYSCAYFREPDMVLEAAQQAKCEHIARKLNLAPGDRVLDIGSGWGGLGIYLAQSRGVQVDGLTLSDDQYRESNERARARGVGEKVRFFQRDYREHEGQYDAVVSVGMFEHVGRPQYPVFFEHAARMLAPQGRMLLHTIGRTSPPEGGDSWIQRYIFPGGYVPSLSDVSPVLEHSGLVLCDLEVLRRHYSATLHAWNERFQAHRLHFQDRLDERFCRMWEFYLQGCEAMFTWGPLVVFHFQLAHDNDVVPNTRDYLYAEPDEQARTAQAG